MSILQIFQDGELTHYVDGTGDQSNWMKYVNCARHEGEQNLVLVQEDGELFYEVCKDIAEGSELLVWYGDSYLKYMGIPITMKTKLTKIENDGGIGMVFKLLNVTFMQGQRNMFPTGREGVGLASGGGGAKETPVLVSLYFFGKIGGGQTKASHSPPRLRRPWFAVSTE